MSRFDFELFLIEPGFPPSEFEADEFLDRVEDVLFEAFEGDVTPSMLGGVPMLYCTIEGQSLGEAFDKVVKKVFELGLHPAKLLMQVVPDEQVRFA